MPIIDIINLSFRYGKKFIFDNFNLSIERGTWVTIVGPNGSGKSTLVKLLAGLEKNYSSISIFNKTLNKKNIIDIRKEIGYVFDTPDNYFACETVEDELAFSLENLAVLPATINMKIKQISKLLGLTNLLKKNPYTLSGGEKQKLLLGCALMLEPRIIIVDDAFMMIDINERKKIFEVLKDYCNRKRVTVVSFTCGLDESLYSDRLIVLNKGKIIVDGPFPYVYEQENVMRKIGIEVPFEVELSQKLKLYNLTDKLHMDMKGLVDELWK